MIIYRMETNGGGGPFHAETRSYEFRNEVASYLIYHQTPYMACEHGDVWRAMDLHNLNCKHGWDSRDTMYRFIRNPCEDAKHFIEEGFMISRIEIDTSDPSKFFILPDGQVMYLPEIVKKTTRITIGAFYEID